MDKYKDLHTTITLQKERIETVKKLYRKGRIQQKVLYDNVDNAQLIIEKAQFRIAQLEEGSQ